MKYLSILISILFIFSFCEPDKRNPDSLQLGMTKSEVHQLLGNPDLVDTIKKNTEIIWGAEEDFWDELSMGTTLEVWIYENKENEFRFYFIDGSDTLSYKIIAPKDVVYESVK